MRHLVALVVKFVLIAVVLSVILSLMFHVSIVNALLISLSLTPLSYVVGDLLIFLNAGSPRNQKTRNSIAVFVDFVMTFLFIWLIGWLLTGDNFAMVTPALISAVVLAGGEWFFHLFVDRYVVPNYNNLRAHQ
ncbi:DUF2512 family protein [Planococcus versutus]|uniref:DUF2512 domain-containing protein n=1 Tax=Planococcus versutus TaxID=1302659 RepID=A0A1B1S327_9BACL|nr:DUF2512 family protein [Planococcus versutus]ANU27591.1 hypothetical protein I858_011405 [Planococcus versutus]